MILRHKQFVLICLSMELISVVFYLCGFMTVNKVIPGHATFSSQSFIPQNVSVNFESNTTIPHYDRLVFVMVDALRADFVLPSLKGMYPQMDFVSNKISNGEAISFLAKAHSPTVTMPRVKAITTGGIPGFVDVVLNFNSRAVIEDNIIHQLHISGRKIVFYGDDTWIKLFPEMFTRTDGTSSFFVSDYTEVDNNVTRHLDAEFSRPDWDVLILHYLGLDHIGHVGGPKSPLVKPKLQEMDAIIENIFLSVLKQDASSARKTLLLVCGDHGMSDLGSHGGSSLNEILTPVVLMSSSFDKIGTVKHEEIKQIDITPTLALLLGVPIPQNSIGSVPMEALAELDTEQRLGAMHSNALQLLAVFKENFPLYERDPSYHSLQRGINLHRNWLELNVSADKNKLSEKVIGLYQEAMIGMQSRVSKSIAKYDLHAMGTGIAILWLILVALIYGIRHTNTGDISIKPTFSGALCFTLMLWMLTSSHVTQCTASEGSPLLCSTSPFIIVIMLFMLLICSWWLSAIVLFLIKTRIVPNLKFFPQNKLTLVLWFGIIIHSLSLVSSSFVEEEHQTWYFYTLSLIIILGVMLLAKQATLCKKLTVARVKKNLGSSDKEVETTNDPTETARAILKGSIQAKTIKERHRSLYMTKSSNSTDVNRDNLKDFNSNQEHRKQYSFSISLCIVLILTLCILHRMCRAWNRTGDKWSHLPDIGDWLVQPDNKKVLSLLCAISLLLVCIVQYLTRIPREYNSAIQRCALFTFGSMMVYCFRAANGSLILPGIFSGISKGVIEARIVFTTVLLLVIHSIKDYRSLLRPPVVLAKPKCSNHNSSSSLLRRFHGRLKRLHTKIATQFFSNSEMLENNVSRGQAVETLIDGLVTSWVLLWLLIVRPHNIPLVAMITLISEALLLLLNQLDMKDQMQLTLIMLWMGNATFFFQGNSNSITTIDVSAGYIGLEVYQPIAIGILMCFSTFAGPIYWMLCLLRQLVLNTNMKRSERLISAAYVLTLCRAIPLAIYTLLVLIQRYHLFVWTVFSPKLLYEGMYTLLMAADVLILCAI